MIRARLLWFLRPLSTDACRQEFSVISRNRDGRVWGRADVHKRRLHKHALSLWLFILAALVLVGFFLILILGLAAGLLLLLLILDLR